MTYDDDLNGRHYNDQNGSLDNTMMNDDHLRGLNQAPRKKGMKEHILLTIHSSYRNHINSAEVFERGNARQQSDLIQLLLRKEKHFDLFLRMYERDRETVTNCVYCLIYRIRYTFSLRRVKEFTQCPYRKKFQSSHHH
jgi:predicted DCC family thiol-disulfide oxidoreductase YuxK